MAIFTVVYRYKNSHRTARYIYVIQAVKSLRKAVELVRKAEERVYGKIFINKRRSHPGPPNKYDLAFKSGLCKLVARENFSFSHLPPPFQRSFFLEMLANLDLRWCDYRTLDAITKEARRLMPKGRPLNV